MSISNSVKIKSSNVFASIQTTWFLREQVQQEVRLKFSGNLTILHLVTNLILASKELYFL